MSLEEDLARRLQRLARGYDSTMPPRMWLEVARECIRQMEWARRTDWTLVQGTGWPVVGESAPLTLAPEDWKP